uniref:Kinesin family member 24 n=1 Tax=Romanomermis culicivorax TaxID=13658 RepID=A0A915JJ36_ROMCU
NGSSSCLLLSPQRTDLPRKGIIRPKGSLESEKCRVVQAPEGADFSMKRRKVKLSLPGFKSSIQQQLQAGPTANNLGSGGTLVRQNRPPPLTLSEYYQQEQVRSHAVDTVNYGKCE